MLQVSKGPIECEMLLPRDMSVAKSTFQREKVKMLFTIPTDSVKIDGDNKQDTFHVLNLLKDYCNKSGWWFQPL